MSSRRRVLRAVAGLAALATSVPGDAVFPDQSADPESMGRIGRLENGKFKQTGCGIVIAENWVISVAHVGGDVFIHAGKSYPIVKKFQHKVKSGEAADLALFQIGAKLDRIATIHFEPIERLMGKPVEIRGFGKTATLRSDGLGWQTTQGSEGSSRLAWNTIDAATASRMNFGSAEAPKWKSSVALVYDLDKVGDKQYSTLGSKIHAMEGGMADRDSGGSWTVTLNGKRGIVALSASVAKEPGSRMPTPYCYGGLGYGIHLYPYKSWMYSVTKLPKFK